MHVYSLHHHHLKKTKKKTRRAWLFSTPVHALLLLSGDVPDGEVLGALASPRVGHPVPHRAGGPPVQVVVARVDHGGGGRGDPARQEAEGGQEEEQDLLGERGGQN